MKTCDSNTIEKQKTSKTSMMKKFEPARTKYTLMNLHVCLYLETQKTKLILTKEPSIKRFV